MAAATLPKGPLWMQNVAYPASTDRTLIDALWATEGVVNGFAVSPGGGLTISIGPGQAVIQGDEVANQGKYLVDSDITVNLLLSAVGVTRTEYVYLLINDPAVAGGRVGDSASIETGASVPANSALLLATLVLPAGTATITAGMVTDSRVFANVVPDDGITAAKIAPGAVGTSELENDSVTSGKLATGAVVNAKIADGAITAGKLADGAITSAKILDGGVGTADIADDAVTQPKIGPSAVGTTELANDGVTSGKLANFAVINGKIADLAVTAAKMADGSVSALKLASNAVENAKILNGAVTVGKLGDGAVTNVKILDGAVTNSKIGDGAVNAAKIADGTVGNAELTNGAVTGAKINSLYAHLVLGATTTVTASWTTLLSTNVAVSADTLLWITATFDFTVHTTDSRAMEGTIFIGGVERQDHVVFVSPVNGGRTTLSKTYVVRPGALGTVSIATAAKMNIVGVGNYTVNQTHTTLSVVAILG